MSLEKWNLREETPRLLRWFLQIVAVGYGGWGGWLRHYDGVR